MIIQLISDLPRDLEIQTCTCYWCSGYINEYIYSTKWRRPIHKQCGKPQQDQVIYFCGICEEYFISETLRPIIREGSSYKLQSVIYIERAKTSPHGFDVTKIKDVYCDDCE